MQPCPGFRPNRNEPTPANRLARILRRVYVHGYAARSPSETRAGWDELAMLSASMYEGIASELLKMGVKVPDES